jgi:hypothetical protein
MKYVTTWELFGNVRVSASWWLWLALTSRLRVAFSSPNMHIFSADDAGTVAGALEILFGCIGVKLVHVSSSASVSVQISTFLNERPEGNVHIANDMEWEPIKVANNGEEHHVSDQLEKIY